MSAQVGRVAVDRLLETALRHGYSALKLKYAGGEPTLAFPLIEAIHAHAAQSSAEAGLSPRRGDPDQWGGCDRRNAGLCRPGRDALDGLSRRWPEAHDRVRGKRDGGSTHASVVSTVERARERGLRPSISITLTELSLDGAGEAVAFALERQSAIQPELLSRVFESWSWSGTLTAHAQARTGCWRP